MEFFTWILLRAINIECSLQEVRDRRYLSQGIRSPSCPEWELIKFSWKESASRTDRAIARLNLFNCVTLIYLTFNAWCTLNSLLFLVPAAFSLAGVIVLCRGLGIFLMYPISDESFFERERDLGEYIENNKRTILSESAIADFSKSITFNEGATNFLLDLCRGGYRYLILGAIADVVICSALRLAQ